MDKTARAAFPYILFAATFVLLSLLFAATGDQPHLPHISNWLAYLVVVPISLLAALRVGELTYRALFVTACILYIATYLAISGLLKRIAMQSDGRVNGLQLIDMAGWQPFVFSFAATVGAPLLGLFVLRHFRGTHVVG